MGSSPRLTVLFPHLELGGGETATLEIAAGLREHYNVTLAALAYVGAGERGGPFEELAGELGGLERVEHRWQLGPLFGRCDALLWYGVNPSIPRVLATLGRRPASIRIVHTERAEDGARFAHRWQRAIDRTLCVSPAAAESIRGARFVPNPWPARRLEGERRELFAPDATGKTLGVLGRLSPSKNVTWLVEHLAELDCRLLLQVLDTEWLTARDLAALAHRRGVADRLRFLPPGPEVGTLLRSVDALVLVSRHEAFPMVVIEAGRVGTPVLATRVGALPKLLGNEILFIERRGDEPDVDSLRAQLERVEPVHGQRLSRAVLRLCDPRRVAASYREAIDEALAERLAAAV